MNQCFGSGSWEDLGNFGQVGSGSMLKKFEEKLKLNIFGPFWTKYKKKSQKIF